MEVGHLGKFNSYTEKTRGLTLHKLLVERTGHCSEFGCTLDDEQYNMVLDQPGKPLHREKKSLTENHCNSWPLPGSVLYKLLPPKEETAVKLHVSSPIIAP